MATKKTKVGPEDGYEIPGNPPATKRGRGQNAYLSKKRVAAALRNSAGIASAAAAQLGVDPTTIRYWMNKHPELRELAKTAEEDVCDLAETKLVSQIRQENMTAIIFFLKTKGKSRGWTERHEVTTPPGQPLEVKQMQEIDLSGISADDAKKLASILEAATGVNGATGE